MKYNCCRACLVFGRYFIYIISFTNLTRPEQLLEAIQISQQLQLPILLDKKIVGAYRQLMLKHEQVFKRVVKLSTLSVYGVQTLSKLSVLDYRQLMCKHEQVFKGEAEHRSVPAQHLAKVRIQGHKLELRPLAGVALPLLQKLVSAPVCK